MSHSNGSSIVNGSSRTGVSRIMTIRSSRVTKAKTTIMTIPLRALGPWCKDLHKNPRALDTIT
jgi:hypothetical protein